MRRLVLMLLLLTHCLLLACTAGVPDQDGDGAPDATDCAPADANRFPGNAEVLNDGIDQNCDGVDGHDADGDGYAGDVEPRDCDDGNVAVHPGAEEFCGDGIDNDCDSTTSDACGDDDDAADDDDSAPSPLDSDDDGDGATENQGDCDDDDPDNFPGNLEVCDGQDNDCLGGANYPGEGVDEDSDGSVACADCDDDEPSVFPAAPELCDGLDNDCSGSANAPGGEDDVDLDGSLACADCDDLDESLGDPGDDADCDGAPTADDCDDADPTSTVVAEDADCDGVVDCLATRAVQGITLVRLCSGAFDRGCTAGQQATGDCAADESPVQSVTLTRGYWMSDAEVTQAQWQSVMGNNPSNFDSCGADCPVEKVNWFESLAFANAISVAEGLAECFVLSGCTNAPGDDMECSGVTINSFSGSLYDCDGYRLPTEAEWEYAARAGTDSVFAGGDTVEDLAWYSLNSGATTHPVATKLPNAWGLYDMSGNVWEWAWDWYDGSHYGGGPLTDPEGPSSGIERVFRGGGWENAQRYSRVSARNDYHPGTQHFGLGIRLVRTLP